jgi:hypothetical protein
MTSQSPLPALAFPIRPSFMMLTSPAPLMMLGFLPACLQDIEKHRTGRAFPAGTADGDRLLTAAISASNSTV